MTKVIVVGSGKWGTNLVRNFDAIGALEGICEADGARAQQLREQFPHIRVGSDLREMLETGEAAAVAVATPPSAHFTVAMTAMAAGRHVFVEKPLTLNTEDAERLVKEAETRNRILMTGHLLMYHPAYDALRKLVADGALGSLRAIHAVRCGLGRARREEDVLFSLAPHDISVIISLLGESPAALSCCGLSYITEGVSDIAYLNMKFSSGRFAQIHVSWLHPVKNRMHTVIGSEKMAQVDETVGMRGSVTLFDKGVDADTLANREGETRSVEVAEREPLKEECLHFISCIEKKTRPVSDGRQGLEVVKILTAASESIKRGGEWIEL